MKLQYSDEMINAYVDGELTGADREAFRQAMEADASLREEARSICELKKQLKQSYGQVPVPGQSEARNSRRVMTCVRYGAAAMLAIVVGTVAGWMGAIGPAPGSPWMRATMLCGSSFPILLLPFRPYSRKRSTRRRP